MNDELIIGVILSIIAYIVIVFYIYDELEKPVTLTDLLFIPKTECILWNDSEMIRLIQIVSVLKWIPVINVLMVISFYLLFIGVFLYIECTYQFNRIVKKLRKNIIFK